MRGAATLVGALAISAIGAVGAVTYHFARIVVTPPRARPEDVAVFSHDAANATITLSETPDTTLPGNYSFWFAGTRGHARLGEIRGRSPGTVTRRIIAVDSGDLALARRGRMGGWIYQRPEDLGLPFEDVTIATPVGDAPAWLVPAESESGRWVIQVHGRAVTRTETLRAVPVFHQAGYTCLLISYRNDGVAQTSDDARYALGDTEWEDVDAAIQYAIGAGAREVVLMGWSMGGAVVLQSVTRSRSPFIRGVVLESPVIDWVTALDYQARALGLPLFITHGVYRLIASRWASRITGQAQPIDLARLDFVRRATELSLPILLFHSDDDGYVPVDASAALAAARGDIVTFERFQVARHTKLWNYDPDRWNGAISRWLAGLGPTSARTTRPIRRRGAAKV
jgi:Dipeptidyl aminopeptidases/acylaminoacyl-peptidases